MPHTAHQITACWERRTRRNQRYTKLKFFPCIYTPRLLAALFAIAFLEPRTNTEVASLRPCNNSSATPKHRVDLTRSIHYFVTTTLLLYLHTHRFSSRQREQHPPQSWRTSGASSAPVKKSSPPSILGNTHESLRLQLLLLLGGVKRSCAYDGWSDGGAGV